MAIDAQGRITAFDIDDLTGIGPYSVYPRTSAVEGNQVVNLIGGPYDFPSYRAKTTVVLQNKVPTCQYRAVGHPIATAVTEGLVDLGAEAMGMDPVAFRLQEPDAGRHLSAHLAGRHALRGPLAHQVPRRADGDDGLPGPARRAGAAARAGRLSRHRLCELHRAHQPVAVHVRHRRRAHLGAGRLHACASTPTARWSPPRASPSRARARKRSSARSSPKPSACRSTSCASSPATRSPPPTAAAPGPAAVPASAARRRCRRALPPRTPRSRSPAPCCRRRPTRSISCSATSSTRRPARCACRSASWAASSTSAATRCRPTCRAS